MKKGDTVKICLEIMGLKSYEKRKVAKVTKKGIYLEGSDYPYNPRTGNMDYLNDVDLGSQYIVGLKK